MSSHWEEDSSDQHRLSEASTRWSLIQLAQHGDPAEAQIALTELVTRYAPPLRRYLQGIPWRFDPHAAEDLVQGFVVARILTGNLLARSNPDRGRFRSLLKSALDNYVRDQLRSHGRTPLAHAAGEIDAERTHDQLAIVGCTSVVDPFDVAWARELIETVITQMRQYCQQHGQWQTWTVFESRLLRPITHGEEPVSYEDLAIAGGLATPKEAAAKLITAKRMFRRFFEETVQAYADDDLQLELRQLYEVFATGISLVDSFLPEDESPESCDAHTAASAATASQLLAKVLYLPSFQAFWSPLELDALLEQLLSRSLSDLVGDTVTTPNASLLEVLSSPSPTLSDLIALKTWAKQELAAGQSEFPSAVVSAFYFAVLSAAHLSPIGLSLTSLTNHTLASSLLALLNKDWINPQLRQLYQRCNQILSQSKQ